VVIHAVEEQHGNSGHLRAIFEIKSAGALPLEEAGFALCHID
jgi:hypothetical protein